ncbi:hypothetical protein E4T56_gene20151 [Termitomyces sp. T112]|nr:hypothetical protein E4T56_gene20151 [Termitomyces sp. T112]
MHVLDTAYMGRRMGSADFEYDTLGLIPILAFSSSKPLSLVFRGIPVFMMPYAQSPLSSPSVPAFMPVY